MTVAELIEILQEFDPQMPVHIQFPSGDYWKTELVKTVTNVEIGTIEWSDYHRKNKISDEGDVEVVILD